MITALERCSGFASAVPSVVTVAKPCNLHTFGRDLRTNLFNRIPTSVIQAVASTHNFANICTSKATDVPGAGDRLRANRIIRILISVIMKITRGNKSSKSSG